ncbi:MAG: D-alanine--D-alanine ligase [Candidatus Marinimicrobia bacterium]|nr:D-alanine--D-alanine ligase [Candidatus Neomarinimicrobiota bacterium]
MNRHGFKQVGVLLGGPSAERDVSLRSGQAVARGLRAAGYAVTAIDPAGPDFTLPAGLEAVFIALHGSFGEDGTVQAELERRGVPYTGSGPAASRRAFDKRLTREAFAAAGLPQPEGQILAPGARSALPLPCIVKPTRQGSSLGVSRVRVAAEWPAALAAAAQYEGEVLVERYIPGRELTVGIVADEPLPVVEIFAPEGCYDYRAKYTRGLTRYETPARLTPAENETLQRLALTAYHALGCRGLSRVDFRLSLDGQPYILEINTIPGFTETSLLPQAACAAGWLFEDLCARIMETAAVDGGGRRPGEVQS